MIAEANPYLARQAELQRMAAARALVNGQLEALAREIRRRAEASAISYVGGKSYCFGRGSTTWRATHERAFQAIARNLVDRHRREIEPLQAKAQRQADAILAFVRRHGLNIDAAQLLGRNVHFDF